MLEDLPKVQLDTRDLLIKVIAALRDGSPLPLPPASRVVLMVRCPCPRARRVTRP